MEELQKLKKDLENMKQKNKNLYKRIIARDNLINKYSSKYNDSILKKELDKIKLDEKKEAYKQNEGGENSLEKITKKENEIMAIQNLLDIEKDRNKKKDNLIMEKEKEIKKIKEKSEQKIKSDEIEMKKLREQIESLQKEKDNQEVKLKEYEERIKKLEYDINKNQNPNQNQIKCETVHKGIKCQKCFQEPIIGYRYKCSVCSDYNLCQNCEEKNSISEDHQHDFIKIRKNLAESVVDINKYSYECINILQLSMYLYEGTEKGQCEIILKNNGTQTWPEGKTQLCFERESEINGDEIRLRPQKPGEIEKYLIILNRLSNYSCNQYKSILSLYIDDEAIGDHLILTINIKEKDKNNKEIEDCMDKITEFRNNYNLGIEDYSNERLFEALKRNNYDYDATFSSLFSDYY